MTLRLNTSIQYQSSTSIQVYNISLQQLRVISLSISLSLVLSLSLSLLHTHTQLLTPSRCVELCRSSASPYKGTGWGNESFIWIFYFTARRWQHRQAKHTSYTGMRLLYELYRAASRFCLAIAADRFSYCWILHVADSIADSCSLISVYTPPRDSSSSALYSFHRRPVLFFRHPPWRGVHKAVFFP